MCQQLEVDSVEVVALVAAQICVDNREKLLEKKVTEATQIKDRDQC